MSQRRKKKARPAPAAATPPPEPEPETASAEVPPVEPEPEVPPKEPNPSASRRKVSHTARDDRPGTLAVLFVAAVLFADALVILGLPVGADIVIPMIVPLGAGLLLALILLRRIVKDPNPRPLLLGIGAAGLLISLGMMVFFIAHLFHPAVDPLLQGLPWDFALALATLVAPLLGLGPGESGLTARVEARTLLTVAIPIGALGLTLVISSRSLAVAGGLGLGAFLILAGALLREPLPVVRSSATELTRERTAASMAATSKSPSSFAPEASPERTAFERFLREGPSSEPRRAPSTDSSFVEAAAAATRPEPTLLAPEGTKVPSVTASPASSPPRPVRSVAASGGRFRTGIDRLDDLLKGGFPSHAQVGIIGPTFIGKETVLYHFLAEGLSRGESVLVIAVSRPPADIAQELTTLVPELPEIEAQGRLLWIDAFAGETAAAENEISTQIKGPGDYAGILAAATRGIQRLQARGGPFRAAYVSLSSSMTQHDERSAFAFFRNLLAVLRPADAATVYSIDRGVIDERQLEELQAALDGGILFQRVSGKTSLSVLGLGDVATRQWVEYRRTDRGFSLGSFALERIR